MAGFVYVMSNAGFDGRLKIGKSIKDPTGDRVEELNSTTGVPEPFKVEYYCYVENFDKLEARVHRLLDDCRPNKRREFFKIDLENAVLIIQETAENLGGIKFEEFYFDVTKSSDALDYNLFEEAPTTENILKSFPKALKVLQYNSAAKAAFHSLQHIVGNASQDFLSILENNPTISDEDLTKLLESSAFKSHFEPFNG